MNWDFLFTYADPTLDWEFAFVSLIIRFVGVFLVLGIMQIALQVSARLIGGWEKRQTDASTQTARQADPASQGQPPPEAVATSDVDDAVLAAIGAALELERRPSPRFVTPVEPSQSSPWAVAGRMQQIYSTRPRS